MFVTTRNGVVLVDAPPTIGHNLLRAISAVTQANGRPANVTHLVYSHSHADHVGASSLLGADVVRIGHSECRRLLLRDNDPNRPAPTVTFDDHYVLELGGERLLLDYHGPNHTPDNIFIYAPDHQTLMVVDVIFPGWVPFKNLAVSQDIPDWIRAQDIAMGYQWQTRSQPVLRHVNPGETQAIAECFLSAMPANSPPRFSPREPWKSLLPRRTVVTPCSIVAWAVPITVSGRSTISSGTWPPVTALTGAARTQPGSCSGTSTRGSPAGPPLRNCTVKSARCGPPASSRSTRRRCSTPSCSGGQCRVGR